MLVVGLRAGYPELAADDQLLTDAGREALARVDDECLDETLTTFRDEDPAPLLAGLPLDQPAGSRPWPPTAPAIGPPPCRSSSPRGADDLYRRSSAPRCWPATASSGSRPPERCTPTPGHVSVIAAAYADIGAYLQARLAGEPASSSC
jgi:hypothetical protein